MELFLSIPNAAEFLCGILLCLSILIAYIIWRYTKFKTIEVLMGFLISIPIIFIIYIHVDFEIEKTKVSDYSWKQIYTNKLDANVTLKPIDYFINRSGKVILEVGQPLGKNAYLFSTDKSKLINDISYDITVKTNTEVVTKRVEISKIISDDKITSDSRIVKIEYRPYNGYYQTWGSIMGNRINLLDDHAEIQVTIQNTTPNKLNELFDPTKP